MPLRVLFILYETLGILGAVIKRRANLEMVPLLTLFSHQTPRLACLATFHMRSAHTDHRAASTEVARAQRLAVALASRPGVCDMSTRRLAPSLCAPVAAASISSPEKAELVPTRLLGGVNPRCVRAETRRVVSRHLVSVLTRRGWTFRMDMSHHAIS